MEPAKTAQNKKDSIKKDYFSKKSFYLLKISENDNNKKREKEKIFGTNKKKCFKPQNLFFAQNPENQKQLKKEKIFEDNK